MKHGEFITETQAAYVPQWVADTIMHARIKGLITLCPRLTGGQRRRARRRTMARGYDTYADRPTDDGAYKHFAYPAQTGTTEAAARTLVRAAQQPPAQRAAAWDAAAHAIGTVAGEQGRPPSEAWVLSAYILMDAIAGIAPSTWRDMRGQLLANVAAAGTQLDPAEAEALDTLKQWRDKRVAALQGVELPPTPHTSSYRSIDRDPRG